MQSRIKKDYLKTNVARKTLQKHCNTLHRNQTQAKIKQKSRLAFKISFK